MKYWSAIAPEEVETEAGITATLIVSAAAVWLQTERIKVVVAVAETSAVVA